jgi:RNA polymerase sigma-70 factor (family 1)
MVIDKLSDKQLSAQLKKGSTMAFNQLFEKYSQRLYGFSISLLKNHEDTEGIVQEVFFKIWKNRGDLNERKDFQSFLFSIAYNLIIDKFRKRSSEQKFEQFLIDQAQKHYETPTNIMEYNELETSVKNAVNELPDRRKRIYLMRKEEGLSYKEIASELSISPKTVENQLNLALKHIKKHLGSDTLAAGLFLYLFM